MTPLLQALLNGLANLFAYIYGLIQYLKLQTRIATASDAFLDLIAYDYFGISIRRKAGQSDASFRAVIQANLFRKRVTRASVISILEQLTGRAPVIVEPRRPLDTGVYGGPWLGYGVAGAYGSLSLPFQSFVTAFRPVGAGIGGVAGYGSPNGAYTTPSMAEYASLSMLTDFLTDSDITAAVESVRPAGYTIWLRISA